MRIDDKWLPATLLSKYLDNNLSLINSNIDQSDIASVFDHCVNKSKKIKLIECQSCWQLIPIPVLYKITTSDNFCTIGL